MCFDRDHDEVPARGEERRFGSPAVAPHPLGLAFLFRHKLLDPGENHTAARDIEQFRKCSTESTCTESGAGYRGNAGTGRIVDRRASLRSVVAGLQGVDDRFGVFEFFLPTPVAAFLNQPAGGGEIVPRTARGAIWVREWVGSFATEEPRSVEVDLG